MIYNQNHPFSLVLGGGAARGLIYLGIYKWLEEHTLYPTEIIGTSMGSLIGAFIAMKVPFSTIYASAKSMHLKKIVDLNFRSGLLGGHKVYTLLTQLFGEQVAETTKIPYKAIALDINTGEKVVMNGGLLRDVIRASIGIPIVFAPYLYNNRYLVDGGVINNLSLEETSLEHILAISSLKDELLPLKTTRVTKRGEKQRGFLGLNKQILGRTYQCVMLNNEKKSLEWAEMHNKTVTLVRPYFPHIKRYDFHKVDEMIEIGYAAMEQVAKSTGNSRIFR